MNSLTICSTMIGVLLMNIDVLMGGVTQNAKKSIFPTTNADRENNFIESFFEPLIDSGDMTSMSTDESYTCGVPSKFRMEGTYFEIHSPFAPEHDSGGFEVELVESYYKEKWDNLVSNPGWYYDAILDNSMAFWVADLDTFTGYNEDGVERVYLKWEWDGVMYYSMIGHNKLNHGDMNQYELISDTFSNMAHYPDIKFIKSEPRAYIDKSNPNYYYKDIVASESYSIMEIGIRKAVSDVDINVDWYISVFSGSIVDIDSQVIRGETMDANGNLVKYAHIMIQEEDSFSVSFFERIGSKTTFGDFSILDFENGLKLAHSNVMVNPFCCVDRWYDLHYAIPLLDDVAAATTLENIMSIEDQLYTVFEITQPAGSENEGTGMFWTMMEPNGQIVQLQGPDTASEDVSVEFAVQPSYWDGAWCPQDNLDEFQEYSFGDIIATFDYKDNEEDEDENNENVAVGVGTTNQLQVWYGHLDSLLWLLAIVVAAFIISLLCRFRQLCTCVDGDKLSLTQGKVSEPVSYTYKTFE